jgi:hypothetical protein
MNAMIEDFRIVPAGHCGSGAMRNLLFHYCKLDLPEGVVFGLGAGLDTVFFEYPDTEPPYMLFGRGASMEADLASTLGLDYTEQSQMDNELAWQEVREEVMAGRPTMLSGDIFYLDYREFKVHFPAHRFILLGFNEDKGEAYIADRVNDYPETCSLRALASSRNPDSPLTTFNLWGKFSSDMQRNDLPLACGLALQKTVERMLGFDRSQQISMGPMSQNSKTLATGLKGMKAFMESMNGWPERGDAAECLQYLDNAITKFGTGGGFFRNHFAVFMNWSQRQRPDLVNQDTVNLAEKSAEQWNDLSAILQALINSPNDRTLWNSSIEQADSIYETEYALFNFLSDTVLR